MTPKPTTPETLAILVEQVKTLTNKVDDIHDKLYGNGTPGIIIDQVNQNNQIEKLLATAKLNAKNIEDLKELSTPRWLGKNWRTIITLAFVFFMVIHSILPADVSLWTLISKFLGGG